MLAALLDLPQATNVSEITISDNSLTAVREVDGGLETLNLSLPASTHYRSTSEYTEEYQLAECY
ncbi:electron transfer flavoprotein subunit beta [Salmonella enterica subsp. enterica serovar Typhimurium]|nr:electron transfer flavoprotein subunit beta [Salmonella enterica subsp. enterica serovar Typhimurium]